MSGRSDVSSTPQVAGSGRLSSFIWLDHWYRHLVWVCCTARALEGISRLGQRQAGRHWQRVLIRTELPVFGRIWCANVGVCVCCHRSIWTSGIEMLATGHDVRYIAHTEHLSNSPLSSTPLPFPMLVNQKTSHAVLPVSQ